jgi:hypothetical protein
MFTEYLSLSGTIIISFTRNCLLPPESSESAHGRMSTSTPVAAHVDSLVPIHYEKARNAEIVLVSYCVLRPFPIFCSLYSVGIDSLRILSSKWFDRSIYEHVGVGRLPRSHHVNSGLYA